MCGIAGVLCADPNRYAEEQAVIAMRDTLVHRGPDGAGVFMDGPCGLGHRRLAIIDLSDRARQPFQSADGRYVIIFNGEIFNYRELRQRLIAQGVTFRSDSDTEVLLNLFIREGDKCLDQLNGMFAFAIWAARDRALFMARDRVGVKPLYYAEYKGALYFASEPKALFAGGVPADIEPSAINELLLFRYIAGEKTVFKHVKRLLPGHAMTVEGGKMSVTRWWNLSEKVKTNRERFPEDPYGWFEEVFLSSVKYRTISDVPVGVMLSGGLDSGSVAAALQANGQSNMAAFTFVFDDPAYNEGPLARLVADRFGLKLHTVYLDESALASALEDAAWLYDEPLVHQNDAQMLALSKEAKQLVTVLLSGEGADEFMGGYVRYKPLNHLGLLKLASWASPGLGFLPAKGIVNRFEKTGRYMADSRPESLVLLNASSVYPADLKSIGISVDLDSFEYRNAVLREAIDLYPAEQARQAMYLDIHVHMASVLDRNDRMTMGAGIECRVPFMDYRLMEMIPALPTRHLLKGKKGKHLLYHSIGQKLPKEVLAFKKLGFSVPWEAYMAQQSSLLEAIASIAKGSLDDLFPELDVSRLAREFLQNVPFAVSMMRHLIMTHLWKQVYFEKLRK
jgi:asparagine synthase (glutamine-hydrolysing)